MNFSDVPIYWLNFALHTAAVSLLAWIAVGLMRDPGRRAFVAAMGVVSILIVPWISAAKMSAQPSVRRGITVVPVDAPKWDGWTITIEDRAPVARVMDAAPRVEQVAKRQTPVDWESVVGKIWVAGSAAGLSLVMLRQMRLARWRKSLRPISEAEQAALGSVVKIDFRYVRSSDEPVSPCVVGFFRPCMVIPGHLFENARRDRLRWAVKHEAEHLRAGDSQWAVLLSIAKSIVWWNPIVHRLCASWAEDREKVCDARAIDDVEERKSYGGFLLELAEAHQVSGAIAMAANSPAARLRRRLESIVQGLVVKKDSAVFKVGSVVCFAIIGLMISFAGVTRMEGKKPNEKSGADAASKEVEITAALVVSTEDLGEMGKAFIEDFVPLLTHIEEKSLFSSAMLILTLSGSVEEGSPPVRIESIWKKPGGPAEMYLGHVIQVVPKIRDGDIEMAVDCRYQFIEGSFGDNQPKSEDEAKWKGVDWTKLRSSTAKGRIIGKPGEIVLVPFQQEEDGRRLYGLFKSTLTSPSDGPQDGRR